MHEKVEKRSDKVSRAIHYLIGEYKLFSLGGNCRLSADFAHAGTGFVAGFADGMLCDWLFKGVVECAETAH